MKRNHRPGKWGRVARTFSFILLVTTIAACASPTQPPVPFPTFILVTQDPNSSPTPTPFQPSSSESTALPSFTPFSPEIPTETATQIPPTLTLPPPTAVIVPDTPVPQPQPQPSTSSRTNYILYATLDFDAHTIAVDETIRYYNTTGVALSEIVLSVQPNRFSGFTLNSVSQDNTALTSYNLSGQRLTISLPQQLAAGAATTLTLSFKINIPAKTAEGLYGYDFNQINLVDWYPFVVPYSNGWILHDPGPFGEHLIYDASDIEVNLKTGSNVIVAASAPSEQNGEWTRYRLYGARTFTLSASDEFLVSESAVGTTKIRSYYFSGYNAAAEGVLYAGVQAVSLFNVKFAPYPYETLAIVQADIHDGQETDGLVFLSTDFYEQFGGGAKNNLTTIGVHEIAHQWWFGLVGNDQALEPWIDESMALYSEKIFYEYNYPRYGDWWWQFRVDYFGPGGYVDSTVYNQPNFRSYTNAVYLNGGHFLQDLRETMGDDAFFSFLKDYAARYSRGRATSYDFFNVIRLHTTRDISSLISEYFSGSY